MRLIDLSNTLQKHVPETVKESPRKDMDYQSIPINNCEYDIKTAVILLLENHNKQYNYTIREASKILNVSIEFIRRRISNGQIYSAKFGDKPMISVFELSRILIEGIK